MLFLLSPAKALDYDSPLVTSLHTDPLFMSEAGVLIDILRKKSVEELEQLMSLSPALAELNAERYAEWSKTATLDNARAAILAFDGDVYEGLQARTLTDDGLKWAQDHLGVLSGLYGVLRPLDLMEPYRLEMGTRLQNPKGANLYDYWRDVVTPYLNERLANKSDPIVINLASQEYFKAVDRKKLKARIVECVFQEDRSGKWRIISFYAKRARGLMARYAIDNQVTKVEDLQGFAQEAYTFAPDASTSDKLVFRRPENWKELLEA